MHSNEFNKFSAMFLGVSAVYKAQTSDFTTQFYWNALKKYEFCVVEQAFSRHATNPDNGQFMPKPADIIRILDGTSSDKSLAAWQKVVAAMDQVSVYDSIAFDDAIIHAVIYAMGGWQRLCDTTISDMPFRAQEFQKRYALFLKQPPLHYPKYLVGIHEESNRPNGFEYKSPVMFGDRAKILEVMENAKPAPKLERISADILKEIEQRKISTTPKLTLISSTQQRNAE
ncbi:MAG: hypothetical protein COC15_01580 [Legionellales bacterium]|nr:MAG: hypothetical protein COC15_01580 [Legionellales bacterium]